MVPTEGSEPKVADDQKLKLLGMKDDQTHSAWGQF
jgi:hypothetical protein